MVIFPVPAVMVEELATLPPTSRIPLDNDIVPEFAMLPEIAVEPVPMVIVELLAQLPPTDVLVPPVVLKVVGLAVVRLPATFRAPNVVPPTVAVPVPCMTRLS
jgi:hypothetical protein